MTRAALADRWSTLWRPAPVPSPRLSRWAWAADAVLAVLLAAATVNGTLAAADGGDPRPPAGARPAAARPAPAAAGPGRPPGRTFPRCRRSAG